MNQYDNLANRLAHYETTGPEIWKQTDGKITHLVCTAGTGGTVTGVAMYLKEKNPNIRYGQLMCTVLYLQNISARAKWI